MTTGLLNPTHIILVLLVALIILGPKCLPQAGRSLGRGMREFRDGITGRDEPSEEPPPQPALMTVPPPVSTAAIAPDQRSDRPKQRPGSRRQTEDSAPTSH